MQCFKKRIIILLQFKSQEFSNILGRNLHKQYTFRTALGAHFEMSLHAVLSYGLLNWDNKAELAGFAQTMWFPFGVSDWTSALICLNSWNSFYLLLCRVDFHPGRFMTRCSIKYPSTYSLVHLVCVCVCAGMGFHFWKWNVDLQCKHGQSICKPQILN